MCFKLLQASSNETFSGLKSYCSTPLMTSDTTPKTTPKLTPQRNDSMTADLQTSTTVDSEQPTDTRRSENKTDILKFYVIVKVF
jgi:hypothetical protein